MIYDQKLKDDVLELKKPHQFRYLKKNNIDLYNKILSKTSFLEDDCKLVTRVFCVINNLDNVPQCPVCSKKLMWDGKNHQSFKQFCSVKCMSNSEHRKQKTKETCLEKYGTEHHSQSNEVKSKKEETVLEKYGVKNISQSTHNRLKMKEICSNRTKEEQTIINNKRKSSTLQRYGVDHISKMERTKHKVRNTIQSNYGVSNAFLTENARKKYHEWHDSKYQFVIEKLNDYNWLVDQHNNEKKTILQISNELGVSNSMVCNYYKMHGIKINQTDVSLGEKELVDYIKQHYDGEVIENDRTIIKPKELDIVLPDLKIAIEYCGLYWHSSDKVPKNYHYDKMIQTNISGYKLITIFEDEWKESKEIVKDKLLNILGLLSVERIFARKCEVRTINRGNKKVFLNQNHIQGDGQGSIHYGLFCDDRLVSVMVFKKRTEGIYELNRFASSCNVVGGFSKLLSYFKKNNEWDEIISFADRRWSEGDLYYRTGFDMIDEQSPDYCYFVNGRREHKFNYRKDKLRTILKNYDESLSETENTNRNGLYRIYNCGLLKFSLKNLN